MFLAVSVGFADNIKKREKRQQERIDKGVESGELTKQEALKLEAQEAKLHREIRKDRKDGGGLTKERAGQDSRQAGQAQPPDRQKYDKQKHKK